MAVRLTPDDIDERDLDERDLDESDLDETRPLVFRLKNTTHRISYSCFL